jgi:hypothetical protein
MFMQPSQHLFTFVGAGSHRCYAVLLLATETPALRRSTQPGKLLVGQYGHNGSDWEHAFVRLHAVSCLCLEEARRQKAHRRMLKMPP